MPKKQTSSTTKKKGSVKSVSTSSAPVAYSSRSKATVPSMASRPSDGSVRIHRTEFVGSVSNGAVTGYALTATSASTPGYDINPANGLVFPWLSGIAVNYERFRFHSLRFRFIPSQPTTTAGRIYAAFDYDYDDAVPTSKTQLMSNLTKAECPVWQEMSLALMPSQLHADMPFKYVSLVTKSNFVEPRTAYCGFLVVAFDTPTGYLSYDMEVSYDVELISPVFERGSLWDSYTGKPFVNNLTDTFPNVLDQDSKYMGEVIPKIYPLAGSPLRVVIPGANECPVMYIPGTTSVTEMAFDLLNLPRTEGALTVLLDLSRPGTTPVSSAMTNGETMRFAVYDVNGAILGQKVAGDDAYVAGPTVYQAAWSVAAAALRHHMKVGLHRLFRDFPTARYLVPLIFSSVSSQISSRKGGVMLEY